MGCFGYICKGCGTAIRGDCFNGGEKCVMIHVRHGEELGRVEGHYDEYGRVVEQANLPEEMKFRGNGIGPNSHNEICNSEFSMEDSYEGLVNLRKYTPKTNFFGPIEEICVDFREYCERRGIDQLILCNMNLKKLPYYDLIEKFANELNIAGVVERYNMHYGKYKNSADEKEKMLCQSMCISNARMIFVEMSAVFYNISDKWMKAEFDNLPKMTLKNYSGLVAYHSVCYNKAMKEGTFDLIPSLQDPNQSWGRIRKKYM